MKALLVLFITTLTLNASDSPAYTRTASGKGATKSEALISALRFIPNDAKIYNPSFNGYSVREYVPKIGYIQTQGNYKCIVRYEK